MGQADDAREMMRQRGLRAAAEAALAGLVEGEPSGAAGAREFGRVVLERLRQSPKGGAKGSGRSAKAVSGESA